MQSTADLKELIHQTSFEQLSYEEKCASARHALEKLIHKFSRATDKSVFKELDRITANLETTFINQRSASHLAKLAYSIYFHRCL